MEPQRHTLHLPVEIIDNIFHYIRCHHYTLASCARVCRFWLPSSQRYLYARVRIGEFKEYPNATTRSLRGGLEALKLVLESSPSLQGYIQRLDVAWSTELDAPSLRSVVSSLPQLHTLAVWHTRRAGNSPDCQILAFDGLRSEATSTSSDRPLLCAEHTWVSLHSEIIYLTSTSNTVQLFLDVLAVIDSTDTVYFMTSRKLKIDQELQQDLRFPTCCRDIRSLDIAFDPSGWFSSRPVGLLLGLLSQSRPRDVHCTHWRYPIHARTFGTLLQHMGVDVEHLHLYLRHFMGETWSDLHLRSCPRLHTIHFTDFWTWFEAADAQILFDAIRRDAPQVRELVFASTMRDLPEKSYETQPQIQWQQIDDLLSSMVQLEKVTVELEAFLPGVRKTLQRLIRSRLPKTWKKSLIRFMLEDVEFDMPSSPVSRDENYPSPRSLDAELSRLML
ncbi:hypothetical protein BC835DRAFT_1411709 [Cytidiella melzeri]|nr:hypothetical protein BC835DRAFT_1411709 [Cytidiella melzeri]